MPSVSSAHAHMNGTCPDSKAAISGGLTRTSTAHHGCRASGNAQKIAAINPTAPVTSTPVTA